ncbi:unnamed protein product [Echinostoma caproni]|uniref:Mitochondrial carrier protein n=1 Tax=Echinostoma caproni TaxID=27848 RepID=A0A183B3T7_9TREM|nr:unnamed protein product [Echinostoma caproni]
MAATVQFTYDYAIPTVTSTLLHPLVYARTMMMLGYEPEPPVLRPVLYTLIDKNYRRLVYPNIFSYLSRLREDVGLFRLFTTGLPASIFGAYIKSHTTEHIMETSKLTAARVAGVAVSYPFQVIMIRQMAEFLGSDGSYSNLLLAIPRMIKQEGILSLFNGLIPRLMGEIVTVWLISCFVYVLNQSLSSFFGTDHLSALRLVYPLSPGLHIPSQLGHSSGSSTHHARDPQTKCKAKTSAS